MYEAFATAAPWRMFDDVLPTLAEVRARGRKLAVVSNWDERLRPLLRELRLIEHFDVVVISQEAGFTKPSPEIFQRAASELGLPPEAILHIGDSEAEDLKGARLAGMKSLLLDRRVSRTAADTVSTLAAVLDVV